MEAWNEKKVITMTKLTLYEKVELADHIKRKIDSMNLNAFAERAAYSMFELQMIREFGETISKEQIADVHEMIDCFKLPEWVTETLGSVMNNDGS